MQFSFALNVPSRLDAFKRGPLLRDCCVFGLFVCCCCCCCCVVVVVVVVVDVVVVVVVVVVLVSTVARLTAECLSNLCDVLLYLLLPVQI